MFHVLCNFLHIANRLANTLIVKVRADVLKVAEPRWIYVVQGDGDQTREKDGALHTSRNAHGTLPRLLDNLSSFAFGAGRHFIASVVVTFAAVSILRAVETKKASALEALLDRFLVQLSEAVLLFAHTKHIQALGRFFHKFFQVFHTRREAFQRESTVVQRAQTIPTAFKNFAVDLTDLDFWKRWRLETHVWGTWYQRPRRTRLRRVSPKCLPGQKHFDPLHHALRDQIQYHGQRRLPGQRGGHQRPHRERHASSRSGYPARRRADLVCCAPQNHWPVKCSTHSRPPAATRATGSPVAAWESRLADRGPVFQAGALPPSRPPVLVPRLLSSAIFVCLAAIASACICFADLSIHIVVC